MRPGITISIIVPTFNRADLLPDAVESVLTQTTFDDELIIVDDGSTDTTRVVAEAYAQSQNVEYVWQENRGRSEARNHGARLAQDTWLGFLDSDDAYTPGAFSQVRSVAEAHPELGMLVGSRNVVDSQKRIIEPGNTWDAKTDLTLKGWLLHCYGTPSSIFIRRDWFVRVGGFDRAYETTEDWDLYLRLARSGCPMMTLQHPVCDYRRHSGNSTRSVENHVVAGLKTLDRHFGDAESGSDLKLLKSPAIASFELAMAVQAVEYGYTDVASGLLDKAIHEAPSYFRDCRITALESILAVRQRTQRLRDARQLLRDVLPQGMVVSRRDVDRAQARVAMRHFFRTQGEDPQSAWNDLKLALGLDPSWLLNRGVLAFILKARFRTRTSPGIPANPS